MDLKFVHKVSKGSRFNQIYIPKDMEGKFDVGDFVEVKLLEKKTKLYYSKNLRKLSEFKEKLIKDIFSFLSGYKKIKQIFIFGSFLTKNIEYNDIDILILADREDEKFEKRIYDDLIEQFNLKFHVIGIEENKLLELVKTGPLIRNMVYSSITNKKIEKLPEIEIDEKNIKLALMLSEDVLDVDVNSRMLYDALRRVLLVEFFIKKLDISPSEIDKKIINLIGYNSYEDVRKDLVMKKDKMKKIKDIIKQKIDVINRILKNE